MAVSSRWRKGFVVSLILVGLGIPGYQMLNKEIRFLALGPRKDQPKSGLFSKVATLPKSQTVLTPSSPLDFDGDGKREFVVSDFTIYLDTTTLRTYEATGNNSFGSVHTLPIESESGTMVSYYPTDTGDSDGDGLKELLVYGRTGNDFFVRLYEASSPNQYPSRVSWQQQVGGWQNGARIADLDQDGKKEIVFGGQDFGHKLQIFENTGNDSYVPVFSATFPNVHTSQCVNVLNDADGDGKNEAIFGGLASAGSDTVFLFESTGDNAYAQAWATELKYDDGQKISCEAVADSADADGDGKREFVVGGAKAVAQSGEPFYSVYLVFEATGNDAFSKVAEFKKSRDFYGDTTAVTGDLDKDGKPEIVVASANCAGSDQVSAYKSSANNTFSEIWSTTWSRACTVTQWLQSLGIGDHDADGNPEIIFNQYDATVGDVITAVFEKSPTRGKK